MCKTGHAEAGKPARPWTYHPLSAPPLRKLQSLLRSQSQPPMKLADSVSTTGAWSDRERGQGAGLSLHRRGPTEWDGHAWNCRRRR